MGARSCLAPGVVVVSVLSGVVTTGCPIGAVVSAYVEKDASFWRDACGHKHDQARRSRVHGPPAATLLPGGRQGEEADARQPLAPARGGDRADPGCTPRRPLRGGRGGAAGGAVASGGARGGGLVDGA